MSTEQRDGWLQSICSIQRGGQYIGYNMCQELSNRQPSAAYTVQQIQCLHIERWKSRAERYNDNNAISVKAQAKAIWVSRSQDHRPQGLFLRGKDHDHIAK